MNMRHHQRQHHNQQNDFGAEQHAVEHIDHMRTNTDHAAGNQRKQQHAAAGGDGNGKPLAQACRQQLASAADIGGRQRVHQKQHAEAGQPLARTSKIAARQGTQAGICRCVLINFNQKQRGIAH